ncbi:MAG TPA: RCC1 repeat-containing protein [Planctomycetota bacterium]|nr:RCC1 repeat-containing protein [Planctomycetota bacterium]
MRNVLQRILALGLLALLLPACGLQGRGTLTPTVAPGIPSGIVTRTGNQSVTIQWTPSAQGSSYTVSRSLNSGGPFFPVSVAAQFRGTDRYVDTGLTNGTTYYYQVVAANAFGESLPSTPVPGTPAFKAIAIASSTGNSDIMALLRDGTLWEWGQNSFGQDISLPLQVTGLPEITAMSSGATHDLALASDGTVWAWGSDLGFQLGTGGSVATMVPAPVLNLTNAVAIAAGGSFSLALTQDGTVWVWGANGEGELGTGATTPANAPVPQPVAGLSNIVAISAGTSHALALRNDGLVFVWGDNTLGQLGNGSASSTPGAVALVSGLTGITAISAGAYCNLALRSDGTIWGWGDDSSGQLGNGSAPTTPVTVPTQTINLTGVVSISASYYASAAVLNDGTVWAWGFNYYGQLGSGTPGYTTVPTPGQVGVLTNVVSVSVSGTSCIAMESDGTVWTWGNNTLGELGNGTGQAETAPVELNNMTGTLGMAGGNSFSLILQSPGLVWGVGQDDIGQLGDGGTPNVVVPNLVRAGTIANATAVAAGDSHGLALLSTGEVWGWGQNAKGQVGDGSSGNTQGVPVKAATPTGMVAIACGRNHSFAIRQDPIQNVRTLWAWGDNTYGMCGVGSSAPCPTPTQVPGLSGVVSVAGGSQHSLAALSDGTVWTWGANGFGQLGVTTIPNTTWTTVPVQVPGIAGAVSVAAGRFFSLALLADGTVWGWGEGDSGQLGHGGDYNVGYLMNTVVPVQALGLTGVTAIAAGDDFSLALRSDGTVWSFGNNVYGALGNPVNLASTTPVQVQGLSGAIQIAAGITHSMARLSNQTVWLWGQNQYDELGTPSVDMTVTPGQVTH